MLKACVLRKARGIFSESRVNYSERFLLIFLLLGFSSENLK